MHLIIIGLCTVLFGIITITVKYKLLTLNSTY